ncbi:hypothetical protein METBIDRAFT_86705 [Metschnikowia bicuspidata var. bicuspidata NRRL YB-4993]|uniref:Uncharacterized protein n=1 Tax=Metschnikowia bicuspidata var. bicuspidata NRRL YB-4993 TaxID=869754 RepID=A0A1A0HDK7_9ASCO|nr:hypothetical protein METBIDRAFT_86705 [Metschnikowia bicuspidata var. bicuspidata NRRL YB-4993]OBA22008.1 hypothetical protein METBIDRAFT_86705 [Metschnikowia bicuspidata var. bicuspidata NRRL YB-4993]
MLVLPNTPCTPLPLKNGAATLQILSPETLSLRASIGSAPPANHAELAQYMLRLEQYLDSILHDIVRPYLSATLEKVAATALGAPLSGSVPWANIAPAKPPKSLRIHRPAVEWTVASEMGAVVIAQAETYMRLGADLIADLVREEPAQNGGVSSKELDEKWRLVAEYYKSATLLVCFGRRLQTAVCLRKPDAVVFHPSVFALFERVCDIGIQMSIVCKSSWMNRTTFSSRDLFTSSNNGVLCRVAIWVFNEVLACQNLIKELQRSSEPNLVGLNSDKWPQYLAVFFKYVTAYSGLFLSIENYQKSKLGQAIGLLNFSLLTLQSRNLGEAKKRGLDRLTRKISGRKNDHFIANLQSVTALDIDKSVFLGLSGAMLSDLSVLFDQLVLLHLYFSKENDNLRFEPVADWKDSRADLKWPLGAKIPVSPAKEYMPRAISEAPQHAASGGTITTVLY